MEVSEYLDGLMVYGGTGRAALRWEAFNIIMKPLKELEEGRPDTTWLGDRGIRICIPTQEILRSPCEMHDAVARKLQQKSRLQEPALAGTLTVTGCDGMGGGPQPLPQKS